MERPEIKLTGYVIYDPETGLYSGGGIRQGNWKKKPKIWSDRGPLSNHLAQFISYNTNYYYQGPHSPYKGHEQIFNVFTNEFITTVKDELIRIGFNYCTKQVKHYKRLIKKLNFKNVDYIHEQLDHYERRLKGIKDEDGNSKTTNSSEE